MDSKNKFPGFIDGLKASNIVSNKTSLQEYSEQILISLKQFNTVESEFIKMNLSRADVALKATIENSSPDELVQLYIKFGDIFTSMISELKTANFNPTLKKIGINYLNIAKATNDSRVTNLAIDIAKKIESN